MNIKHITGAVTLCSLFAASMSAESYRLGSAGAYNKEAENTKTVTDDTIKIKGYQDKAYAEASIKMDSIKYGTASAKILNMLFREDTCDTDYYTEKFKELEDHTQMLSDDSDDEYDDFILHRFQ